MADLDDIKDGKDFGIGTPQQNVPFTLKGCGSLDWGMQSRLARIFNPQSNRTVMLAFDHGYFQGPTTGLERIDLSIAPLAMLKAVKKVVHDNWNARDAFQFWQEEKQGEAK